MKIAVYTEQFQAAEYHPLFHAGYSKTLANINRCFGEIDSEETIFEIELNSCKKECDFSFRVDTGVDDVREYWYELDEQACSAEKIEPCLFIDATSVRAGKDNASWYERYLTRLTQNAAWLPDVIPMLERVTDQLVGNCSKLYQIGWMKARGQQGLRVFTNGMKSEAFVTFLNRMGWIGDAAFVKSLLDRYEKYTENGIFILDFDISADGISEKIGINFGPASARADSYQGLLLQLMQDGLCRADKGQSVKSWLLAAPCHSPYIYPDISHFKFAILDGEVQRAKAYLRQSSRVQQEFPRWKTPLIMNLELTERCPLRCPQCYCELEKGRDLPLDIALERIADAGKNRIQTLNLSGGETLCYPHLCELIAAGKAAGMEVNIALSGWGFDLTILHRLTDAGVDQIFVSLNGSTPEINAKSRDGYALAVAALHLLQQEGVGAHINWVMHRHNSDDFPEMLKLAELYGAQSLIVMAFKPDFSHSLPTVPRADQVRQVAKWIKAYHGPVQLQVEDCFSQMKALVNRGFFGNFNRGIFKGCGAGRDALSVAVNGRFTACRHLPLEEDWPDIASYWNGSEYIKALLAADNCRTQPCASCELGSYCRPCFAENVKLYGKVEIGNRHCPLCEGKIE
ncbi:radical SAM protein [Oscillospiraceae bacterium PP1C4]